MSCTPSSIDLPDPASGGLRRYRGDHGAHVHGHAQVLLGVTGCLEVEVAGRLMRVDASAGLIVPAGARHGSATRHGADVWVIDVPEARGFDRVRPFVLAAGPRQALSTAQWLDWARSAPRALPRRRLEVAALARAVASRLHEDWPAARMAAHFVLSVPQFHARWRALTGRTPHPLRQNSCRCAGRPARSRWCKSATMKE